MRETNDGSFQGYADAYELDVSLPPVLAEQRFRMTCATIFEAWDCYTRLTEIDGFRQLKSEALQRERYGMGLIYLEQLHTTILMHMSDVKRRRHQSLSVCKLISAVANANLLPVVKRWHKRELAGLTFDERVAFVGEYETLCGRIDALLAMLRDLVRDTYLQEKAE